MGDRRIAWVYATVAAIGCAGAFLGAAGCVAESDPDPGEQADASSIAGERVDAAPGAGAADAAPGQADASTGDLCAEPGAVGNSMGVGKYCQSDADCSGQAAGLCTVVQQSDAPPFCTKVCFGAGDECGPDASCEGDGLLRGCAPKCLLD